MLDSRCEQRASGERTRENPRRAEAGLPRIEARELAVEFPRFVLSPSSFSLFGGERVALVGPNGAGKSTMLNILAGRHLEHRGTVLLDGTDLRAALPEARAQIGMLGEVLRAYPWLTIADYFGFLRSFYATWDREYERELMAQFDLDPSALIGPLSKGTRVKVGFIAAEAFRPPVLLLDEPTAGLDPFVRRELIEVVHTRVTPESRRVLLFSTHILEDIELIANRVLVIARGRLRLDSTVAELRERYPHPQLSGSLQQVLHDAP